MAEVFRAELEVAGIRRAVAIKRILAGPQETELSTMLLDEARIWVRLQHANIVSVLDFGQEDGDWFLVLELVEGCTAGQLVSRTGPLPPREALTIVERVARALAYAHDLEDGGRKLGIIHRDVKPANILLSTRGDVKLTDFGIARATDRVTRTQAGVIKGSLPFLSPEQVRGEELDPRSDLFALGCTLHSLLTGRVLIQGGREATLAALAQDRIPAPPEDLAPAVRALLLSLTAADRRKRPATAMDVAKQVRGMLLPESPEDVEPAIAVLVRQAAAPESVPRVDGLSPLETEPPVRATTAVPIGPRAISGPDAPTVPPAPAPASPASPVRSPLASPSAAPGVPTGPGLAAASSAKSPAPDGAPRARGDYGPFESPLHAILVTIMGLLVVWVGIAILFHRGDDPRPAASTARPAATAAAGATEVPAEIADLLDRVRRYDAAGQQGRAIAELTSAALEWPDSEPLQYMLFVEAVRGNDPDAGAYASRYVQRFRDPPQHVRAAEDWLRTHRAAP